MPPHVYKCGFLGRSGTGRRCPGERQWSDVNKKESRAMTEIIAGVRIPDSILAQDATALIRDTTTELIYHHSRRVFLFGSLQSRQLGLAPDPELLYIAAMFHDTGLVPPYRGQEQRFELDSADAARDFLGSRGLTGSVADVVWTAIALHTTPEVPYRMDPVIAATTAGVETDVLGIRLGAISDGDLGAVTAAHPRPNFKSEILQAFTDGFQDRPDTTFGTVNADVLEHFVPGFRRIDFVDVIKNSAWPE
jgi:HD domain